MGTQQRKLHDGVANVLAAAIIAINDAWQWSFPSSRWPNQGGLHVATRSTVSSFKHELDASKTSDVIAVLDERLAVSLARADVEPLAKRTVQAAKGKEKVVFLKHLD